MQTHLRLENHLDVKLGEDGVQGLELLRITAGHSRLDAAPEQSSLLPQADSEPLVCPVALVPFSVSITPTIPSSGEERDGDFELLI